MCKMSAYLHFAPPRAAALCTPNQKLRPGLLVDDESSHVLKMLLLLRRSRYWKVSNHTCVRFCLSWRGHGRLIRSCARG